MKKLMILALLIGVGLLSACADDDKRTTPAPQQAVTPFSQLVRMAFAKNETDEPIDVESLSIDQSENLDANAFNDLLNP